MKIPRMRPALRVRIKSEPLYWERLGQFIETYAETEAFFSVYFARSVQIRDAAARVIFQRAHTAEMLRFLREIWRADSMVHPEKDEMDVVFSQLQAITGVRNSLMHYASLVTDDGSRIVSDIVRAVDVEHARDIRISPENLAEMTADLERISLYMIVYMANPNYSSANRLDDWPELVGAWRYKGPQRPNL